MRWRNARRSENVVDRRGARGRGIALGGGGLGLVVIVLLFAALGGDPMALLEEVSMQNGAGSSYSQSSPTADDVNAQFVAAVLGETEDVWHKIFAEEGIDYHEPRLVLFNDIVSSACGTANSAVGPFYCPADQQIYIDLAFFDELQSRFGAEGDFARAYVIAHEVGHHVQNLLGISRQVRARQAGVSRADANAMSVRLELQADYLAGVWAHHARRLLEPGDIDEAINAASAIGDDRLQRQAGGVVVPDSFTHGTSEQRKRWFIKGYESGSLKGGDTFSAGSL